MLRLARRSYRLGRWVVILASLAIFHALPYLLILRFAIGFGALTSPLADAVGRQLGVRATLADSIVQYRSHSTLAGLRLYEDGQDEPFLVAGHVETDFNVLQYLRGRPIRRIDLSDVEVRLRFDAAGRPLTRLSPVKGAARIPALRVRNGRLTLAQEGREPFTLEGVSLTLEPGKRYELFGVIDDPKWGPLDVNGSLDPRTLATAVRLSTPGLAIDPAMPPALPFVSPKVWERIEVQANRAVLTFDLALSAAAPRVSYRLDFSDVTLGLKQADRPTFRIAPTRGVLAGDEDGFRLGGDIDDPKWGKWAAAVELENRPGELRVALSSPLAVVDQARLEELPFVPRKVWDQVKVSSGETAATVRVRVATKGTGVGYRVDLDVKRADLRVSSLDLPLRGTSGEVIVEDGRVWLRRVAGVAAEGRVHGQADLDFRQEPSKLRFLVEADGVRLRELPRAWNLPAPLVDGNLRGQADLTVTVRDGKAEPTGTGTACIDEARVLGFPTKEPIELVLRADGSRIGFEPLSPAIRKLMDAAGLSSLPGDGEPVGEMAAQAGGEVARTARQIARGASWAMNWLGATPPPRPAAKRPYVDASVALDDVDLDELFRRLEWFPPPALSLAGKLSLRVRVGVPVDASSPLDLAEVRVDGQASLQRLSVAGVEMRNLLARVDYRDGVLTLDRLTGEVGDGAFSGRAMAALFPRGPLAVTLAVRRLPLPMLVGTELDIAGTLSGELSAAVPLGEAGKVTSWRARAILRETRVGVRGVGVDGLHASVSLDAGSLALTDVRGAVGTGSLRGSAVVSLNGSRALKADLSLPGVDLAALGKALPEAWRSLAPSGRVDLDGKVSGTLTPLALSGGGRLAARDLGAAGVRADSLTLRYDFQGDTVSLSDIDARLHRGRVSGSATLPLEGEQPARLDLVAQDIDAGAVAATMKLPVQVGGKLSGRAKLTARRDGGRWRGEVSAQSTTLVVQNVPVSKLEGTLKWRGPRVQYQLSGSALGGDVSLDGSYPPPPMRHAGATDGRLRLDRIMLRGLAEALGGGERMRALDGMAWLEIPYNHDGPKLRPRGQGRFVLRDLRWADRELADDLIGYLRLGEDGAVLRDVTSSFAGGLLRVSGAYRFSDPSRSYFSVSLIGAEGSRLSAFGPAGKELLSGPVNVTLRGGMGLEWSGSGSVVMARGKVAGVEVTEWRAPFDFRYEPREGRLELTVRESQAQVGTGRALLDASLAWGRTVRVEGKVRFFDAGLKSLSGVVGDVSTYASGRVTGRVDFAGTDMIAPEDLNATIQARMSDAQALQLPVLSYLVPYLVPGQGATTFQSGEIKARLSGGVLRIRELSLASPSVSLMLQGNVTLRQTRLDLDVMARTSPLGNLDPLALRVLLRQVPAVGPVPVGVIVRTTQLIAERSVTLHVGGTFKTPVVRVQPLQTLSDEAARFFLGQAVGTLPVP